MRKITKGDKFIIGPIENYNSLIQIKSILIDHNMDFMSLIPENSLPISIRICDNTIYYVRKHWLYEERYNILNSKYTFLSDEEFLYMFQVFYEHKGLKGTHERSYYDRIWHGKILDIDDLVTYESDDLIGLEFRFMEAVDDYLETRRKLKERKMNMKELRWEIISDRKGKYVLYDGKTDEYMFSSGKIKQFYTIEESKDVWNTSVEAAEFLETLCENEPELAYRRSNETFLSIDVVSEIVGEQIVFLIESIVERIMEDEMSFTRHDVLKSLRQVIGPEVEVSYKDWKDLIVEIIELNMVMFDFSRDFKNGRFEYFYDPEVEGPEVDEESEVKETITVDSAAEQRMQSPTVSINEIDTSEPKVVKNRHTVSAETVRAAGGYPGDTMHIIVCYKHIIINYDTSDAAKEWANFGRPTILLNSTLKVDKNGNVRISKYMFDLADLGDKFGKNLNFK